MDNRDLPPLREELTLYAGPHARDGSPTWTIHDPPGNRFFALSWLEFEILRRWEKRDPGVIAGEVTRETALHISKEHVNSLRTFLEQNDLLHTEGGDGLERHRARRARSHRGWISRILTNYLFFRIPLVNPEPFLRKTYPLVKPVFTPACLALLSAALVLGLFLALRQWDVFTHTFLRFLSPEGLVFYALAVTLCKIVHELAHAYTAHHMGCRVPTIGVAFLVLWPVLYTDTTEAWKLDSYKKRLAISGAGMAAEMGLAALALLAWSLLPDGTARSAAFVMATSAWVLTLAVNLNPLMKFDGYYLLSDLLREPNLQAWAFRVGRWWLRKQLFGLDHPCPGNLDRARRNLLTLYAIGIWLYRFLLFLGIAFMVYHLFFKALGILLFVVEITLFILRPVFSEVREWWKHRKEIQMKREVVAFLVFLALAAAVLIVPWNRSLHLPATRQAARETMLYAPFACEVKEILVQAGGQVRKGETLLRLASDELEYKISQVGREMDILKWQFENQGLHSGLREKSAVIRSRLDEAASRLQGLDDEKGRLTVRAPFSGNIAQVSDAVQPGQTVSRNEPLVLMVSPKGTRVEAYVKESDLKRVQTGEPAVFYPEDPDSASLSGRVSDIDRTAVRHLGAASLASPFGGAIPALPDPGTGRIVPTGSVYRVVLSFPETGEAPRRVARGVVRIKVRPEGLITGIRRRLMALLIRESGF